MRVWKIDCISVERIREQHPKEFVTAFYTEKFMEDTVLTIHDISETPFSTAYRFNLSGALPKRSIGTVLGEMIDGVWWYDPPRITYELSGETIVMSKDCFVAQLFMKRENNSPFKSIDYHIIKKCCVDVLNRMGIPAVISYNDTILALPNGKNYKIGCGFVKGWVARNGEYYRREGLVMTFYYNHDEFASILPVEELNRDKARDKDHGGITGIENNYQGFDRTEFETLFIEEVRKVVG